MKKRLLSIFLTLCMTLTMLPVSAFAAQTEEALYAQMLELGLVDGDGALIGDNSFTVEDGTRLSSLDELVAWLNQCSADELDTRIRVDATGRSATAEQLMYALSIEYQMADLAQTLNRLASGSESLLADGSADTSVHDLQLHMTTTLNADNGILTIKVVLYDRNNEEVTAPHDIGIQIGMFADFLTPYQSDFYTDDDMPGGNYFKDFTISKGSGSVELNLSMDTLRGYLRSYEGHWDGYASVLFQARTAYGAAMPACAQSCTVRLAADSNADAIVSAITGGTQIGRRDGNGTSVVPYHLDWSQHDSATGKVTVNGTDYFKINTAVPAARGYSYDPSSIYNETHGWMDTFNQALKLGAGDPDDPKVNLANVTLWTKDGSREIKPMSISIMEGEDLVKIARSSWSYDTNDFSDSDDAAYLADLARVQEMDWDYANPSSLNFYKQVKNHNWRVRRFTNVKVPITPTDSNYVWYPQDWYLPVSWIAQNDDADIRPEEILIHGALTLADETAPTVVSVDTCARTPKYAGSADYWYSSFYPGNVVPIVVTFSEPVYGDYELAYLDGTETKYLSTVNTGIGGIIDVTVSPSSGAVLSRTRVFYYPVSATDSVGIRVLGVKPVDENACKDAFGNKFKAQTDGAYKEFSTTVLGDGLYGGNLDDSFISLSAETDPQDLGKANFQVELNNDETFQTKWLEWSQASDAGKVTVVLDGDPEQSAELHLDAAGTGSQQRYILTGSMTLPGVSEETSHTAELYFNDSLYYGACALFTQQPVTLADESAYTIGVNTDGWPSGIEQVVFLQDAEVPVLGFTDNNTGYTYSHLGTDDVQWTVSDPEILQLTAVEGGGTDLSLTQTVKAGIIPLKAGTATIFLQCGNNGKGTTTASNAITVTVKDSGRPSILFPAGADTVYARLGTDQTVHFASNLSEHGPADGRITAMLYAGSSIEGNAEPVWKTTLERTAARVTIPGGQLAAVSKGEAPSYILRLTAEAEVDGVTRKLSTEAKLIVRSRPAVITLTGLDEPMFTSDQSIGIGWRVDNFDLTANEEECRFQFTVEKNGVPVYTTTEKAASGSYTLTPDTPEQLKDHYIVTAKAKNGADPTWSIASSTITVYRSGALDILVGGEKRDSVTLKNDISGATTTAPSVSTYAGEVVSGLTSAQAIANLRSELSLMESIGINFQEYDWSILYDTVRWSTSTGQGDAISDELQRAVSINYREGSLYAPLEQYSYTCYLPQTILLLCGLRDGGNTVTAVHSALPSLSSSVTVNVETLKDKLYLFQFTPAVRTELSYEDGRGQTHTLCSNDDGSLALFEPNGIASDLRAASVSGGVSYRGTVSPLSLKSGEGSGVRGELYPLNTAELRRAAAAQVQLLRPDGTPLANTDVTLRGGVYRNRYAAGSRDDAYCAGARFAKAAGQAASLDGTKDQTFTTDANGMLSVHMDLSQFTSKNDPGAVGVGDSLEFIFELRFSSGYYPEIITVDGSLTQRDAMRSGEDIVTLTAAGKEKPFVAVQTVSYTGREIDVRRHTGVVGPSSNYPSATLESSIMLWGVENVSFADTGYRFDLRAQETGVSVPEQKTVAVRDASYPFSSIPLVSNSVAITSASFRNYDGSRKTPLEAALYNGDGGLVCTVALPFGLADLTTIERVEEAPSVMSLMANLAAYGSVGGANTEYEYANKVSDGIMMDALSFLEKMGGETGLVKAILMPTEDPTRYEAYLWTGINTTKLEDLEYDRNGISLEPSYIGQDYDSLLGQVNDTFTLSDFQAMADGSYFDDRSSLYGAASGAIGLPVMLQLEGWVSTEIRYSFDKGQWQVLTTGGGFTAGAQLEFEKVLRCSAYGIPLTASFKVRGGATVDFQSAVRYAEQLGLAWNDDAANAVNDYLTALRINAYFEFFGGLGYDQGFTAKVGVFGTIEINNENRFLTRKYLKDPGARDVRGQFLQLDGEAGIRAALGVGPLVTELTLVSLGYGTAWRFNDWNEISDYWESASSGLGSTGWLDDDLAGRNAASYGSRSAIVAAEPVVRLQSRDYLSADDHAWLGGSGIALMSLDGAGKLQAVETNSYPFSTPMISDDGRLLVYLSDVGSTDVTDVEARYSLSNGGAFPDGTAIPGGTDGFSGYGDSSLDFAGTGNFAGAVWLREAATLNLKAGTQLNEGQQTVLLNGLEVMASIWNGSEWVTTRLTENGSQEFEPVIAVNGSRAIAAWRAVQTDESAYAFTQNRILCKVFDGTGWSAETYTLYNGSAGEVTGMTAGMLADGTAAAAFSVKDADGGSDIYYTLVNATDAALEDTAKTVRATTGACTDGAPRLTTVGDQFVLGWSSVRSSTGAEQHDVGLRVFDRTGAPRSVLPESLGDMVSTAAFDGQFTFVKGADTLDELSILWNDANAGSEENDVIRAVKFVPYDGGYLSSAAIEVAELPARTRLNHMDAFTVNDDGTGIRAVLQGTSYSSTEFDEVSYSYELDGALYSGAGRIPRQTVNLYSAAGTYADAVEIAAATVDYTTLTAGSYVPVSFTVANRGMHIIDRVTITLDGAGTQTFTGLAILPGQSKTLSAAARTGSEIEDLNYRVEAGFAGAAAQSVGGTVYLDYPDVGISALTVTRERDGLRTVLAHLYNQAAASLNKPDRRVVLGAYSDPECTMPVNGKYFEDGIADKAYERILTGGTLALIDGAGCTQEMTFDIEKYVSDAGLKEIPDSGVVLFIKARIERQIDGEWTTVPEADSQNNQKYVTFDSLLTRNENMPVTISAEMENGSATTANVQVRNNSLQPRSSGNLTAALLDENGALLETKALGDLTLAAEEIRENAIAFSRSGARVVLRYGEAASGKNTANAASITIDGLPLTMDSFDANDSATVKNVPAGQYLLTVIPESSGAAVAVNGKPAENGMAAVIGDFFTQTITVTITAPDGSAKRTYTICLSPASSQISGPERCCTLTFETNGGSEIAALRGLSGSTIDLAAFVPTRSGYTFTGWYADSALTERVTEVTLTGSRTVYAGWQEGASPFADVLPGSYYYDAVRWAVENGITAGTSAAAFSPDASCDRAQTVTFLWRAAGSPVSVSGEMPFADVPTGSYYYDAVLWAMESGITKGTGDTTFSPDAVCSRAQIVTFLWRSQNAPAAGAGNPFADVKTGDYYAGAVLWAVSENVTKGTSDTTFSPDADCTRAQIVTLIWRALAA